MQHLALCSQLLVQLEDWVQLHLAVFTETKTMTVKLQWSAVYSDGQFRTLVTTELKQLELPGGTIHTAIVNSIWEEEPG